MSSKSRTAAGHYATPSRGAVSMPRDLSHTPGIAGLATNLVQTPYIQKCHVRRDADSEEEEAQQPLEHMVVSFEEDGLQLTTTSLLGKGGFGRVYSARSNSGELYALKASSKKMSEGDWRRLKEEVALMSHFSRHPNVVKFIAAGRDDERAYVVMECCASRSLHDVIAQNGLNVPEILWIGWALIDTIAFMHSKGCIHRDLKPQNLLFDFEGNLKITDFGLSSRMADQQPRKTVAGTAMYMAPEIAEAVYKRMTNSHGHQPLQYGKEVDTWSVGVVLYVMLTRMNPYVRAMEKEGTSNMDKNQKTMILFNAVAGAAWSWPPGWSGDVELCGLVSHILHRDPAKRAMLQEVLEHPLWSRRPLSCPLSLLQKLNLLDRSASPSHHTLAHRSLSRVAENLPIPATKKTADVVLSDGIRRVVLTEERTRAQLALEHHETLHVLLEVLKLSRGEADSRHALEDDEKRHRVMIQNQRLSRRHRRGGSEVLVTAEFGTGEKGKSGRSSRSQRQSSVMLVEPPNTSPRDDTQAQIVRASPDKYAVVYPGRETATRWSLRPVVSLPRELNSVIEDFKCMNNHSMTKLTAMPHGYNGFDCNVCDRGILKITVETPAFRCYKCDYDICMKCAYQGRFKDVNFICVTCTKKFTSSAKLQSHSLMCRGPSLTPSPRRSSRMNTMLWDDDTMPKRRSLLEVQLPDDAKPPRHSGRPSGRSSIGRASSGGRITTGDSHVPSPEDVGAMVLQHRDASFPEMHEWGTKAPASSAQAARKTRGRSNSNSGSSGGRSSGSFSFELPPQVRLSKQQRVEKRAQPRSSAELKGIIEVDSPPLKKGRLETQTEKGNERRGRGGGGGGGGEEKINEAEEEEDGVNKVFQRNEMGEIIGIAAQRRAAREGSLQQPDKQLYQQQHQQQSGVIVIRAENATKPMDMPRQSRVPRSASARRADSATREVITHKPVRTPPPNPVVATSLTSPNAPVVPSPTLRQPSMGGMTARGGPPLPRRGPAAPNFPITAPNIPISAPNLPVGPKAVPQTGGLAGAGAFLALPREEQNRQRFVDDFLSGGWVRFYSFANEETVVMFYCLQPGRYGAVFPTEAGVGTAVVDIHSKLVLYVPCMNNESTNRSQPHPHVQTFYDEDVRLLSVAEAQRYLGGVLKSVMGFVSEIARLRAEGLTPAAVHAAYIHQRNKTSVPTDTKFVYVRKVFPDPSGTFTLFRLSNLRSQVVCNTLMDIRWQSDRRHNVGQKYYIHADGTAEPFVVDHTGILAQVETVLSNNFRR